MSVTVVPAPCGRTVRAPNGCDWVCGDFATCRQCESLGDMLLDNAHDVGQYQDRLATLAWNLTLAALMGAAASQAIERERFRSGVAANYNLAAFGGPCP